MPLQYHWFSAVVSIWPNKRRPFPYLNTGIWDLRDARHEVQPGHAARKTLHTIWSILKNIIFWNLSELILILTWKTLGQLCTPASQATQCSIEEHLGKDFKNRPSGYHSKVPKHAWKYFHANRTWISRFSTPSPKTITCHGMLQVHIIKIQYLFSALSSIHLSYPLWTSFTRSCLVLQFSQTGLFVTLNEKTINNFLILDLQTNLRARALSRRPRQLTLIAALYFYKPPQPWDLGKLCKYQINIWIPPWKRHYLLSEQD